ncbi:FACT complex component Pob3 [Cunninghamella echinulata]|nr:FACT complex component Pob3 [Cunninghamella echinulata]
MSDRKHVDFNSIYNGISPNTGRFRLASNGIGWKGVGDPIIVHSDDLKKFVWMRVARGYQLRVLRKDNQVHKFDGFHSEDLDALKDAIKIFYKLPIDTKETSVKGWNWGQTDFQGSNLIFNVSNKTLFELPLAKAIGANKAGKNEVSINFVDPGQPAPEGVNPKEVDELMDVTFYIPGTIAKDNVDEVDDGEEEVNADMVFYDTVKSKLEFSQMTTENIVQFQEVLCLTPRGRYNIDMYQDFLRLRGKTYDYKILYSNIIKLFLLLKPDEVHVLFVMGLDPPLRQGQTKYPFLVFQFVREDEIDVELNLDDTKLDEKYENKLQKHYDAPTYEVVSTIFRALTGRKVTVPGTYRSHHGAHALKCSMKANEGYLYPLEKSFLFIPKPTTFIPFNEIGVVNFSRVGTQSGTSSRTFDMKFHMKGGNDIQFSSINREEYANLEEFLRQKQIKVKTEAVQETIITYTDMDEDEEEEDMGESRKKRRTGGNADMDMGDDEDDESPDEDFAPNESGSDVAEEYDSDVQSSSGEEVSDDE